MSKKPDKPSIDLRVAGDEILLPVRVLPKSSRNRIESTSDGRLRVALTAPPVEGAANKALCVLLAKHFHIPKRNVRIVQGEKSKMKVVAIRDRSIEEIRRALPSSN